MPALPRREVRLMLDAHVDKLARRPHTLEVRESRLHPRVVLRVAVKSGRHVSEHAQRNVVAVWHPRGVLAHRIVKAELLLVGENKKKRRGEGLGNAADTKVIHDAHWLSGFSVGHAACGDVAALAGDPDAHDDPRGLRRSKCLPQRGVDRGPFCRRKRDVCRICDGAQREQCHHQAQGYGAWCAKATPFGHGVFLDLCGRQATIV